MKQLFYLPFRAMGCAITVQLETEEDGHALLSAIPAQVETVEARLSRFRPDSELMRLNAHAGQWVTVSAVLFDNIHAAKHAARMTEGDFNPLVLPSLIANGYDRSFTDLQVPISSAPVPAGDWRALALRPSKRQVLIPPGSALDLGGIAKGWMAARLADELAAYGACLVNIGGDLAVRGAPQATSGWQIDIEDPHDGSVVVSLQVHSGSIVTSGTDYRRWTTADGASQHHIINPHTGRAVETDVFSVTVHHPHAPTAEAYAKAVLLRGAEAGLLWLQSQWHTAGLVVLHNGAVFATPNFSALIVA